MTGEEQAVLKGKRSWNHFLYHQLSTEQNYSNIFDEIMHNVVQQLLKIFHGIIYAYTQSDEITLIFNKSNFNTKNNCYEPHIYNGRRDKLLTIISGVATQSFNKEIMFIIFNLCSLEIASAKYFKELDEHYFSKRKLSNDKIKIII